MEIVEVIQWIWEHLYPVIGALIALAGSSVVAVIIAVTLGAIILAIL